MDLFAVQELLAVSVGVEHAVAFEDLTAVREVDRGDLECFGLDVFPDVELGPVRQRERAGVLTGPEACVVEVPQFGALVLWVPRSEVVADREDAFLRAGAFLIAACATDRAVKTPVADGVQQSPPVCNLFLEARGPVSSTTRPWSIESCTQSDDQSRSPSLQAAAVTLNSIASGKFSPVSTCNNGKGNAAWRNAFSANRNKFTQSNPSPRKQQHRLLKTRRHLSRNTCTPSDSRARRWVRRPEPSMSRSGERSGEGSSIGSQLALSMVPAIRHPRSCQVAGTVHCVALA